MEAETAGLLGALIGAFVSIATTFLSNRHAISMQSSADAIQREEKARAFQRENLLACQEMMPVLHRLTAKAFFEQAMAWGEGTAWGSHRLSNALDEDLATEKRKFAVLVERVADDALRNELKLMNLALTQVQFSESFEEAGARLNAALVPYEKSMQSLGVILRATY